MRKVLALLLLLASGLASAATVNWIDTADYQKPAPLVVTEPSGVTNLYWVNLASGSGSTCTSVAPCAMSTVVGKAGTTGGPAIIYIKGTGDIGAPVLFGSAGNEIVIKPWDDSTQATIQPGGGRITWTQQFQYVIFDGGPNLKIKFTNSSSASDFDPIIYFNASGATTHRNITFYRTEWAITNCTTGGNGGICEMIAQWGQFTSLAFINSEFHADANTNQAVMHHLYFSGASNFGPSTGLSILNNIFRNEAGEAMEFRLFENMTNVIISGNVFHDLGSGICSSSWKCRSAITIANGSGGTFIAPFSIINNLFWNLGEGCVRPWDVIPATKIYNNTCYNWGVGTPANGAWGSAAMSSPTFSGCPDGDYQNNAFYATGNDGNGNAKTPFPFNVSCGNNNGCISGTSCGTSAQTISGASFQSVSSASRTFLKLANGSTPIDNGATQSTASPDYMGKTRPAGASYDIGAFEAGSSGSTPSTPGTPH